jgi:hypothetical protein
MRLKRQHVSIAIVIAALLILLLVWRSKKAPVFEPSHRIIKTLEKAGPPWAYPNPSRTPGLANPDITQANIGETICNPNWSTESIRPPASYTTKLKKAQMQQWGLPGNVSDYEEDHLVSLELGGDPRNPKNLWPESYKLKPGAKEKDVVEKYLHKQVCAGTMTLAEAQRAIATDWYRVYLTLRR